MKYIKLQLAPSGGQVVCMYRVTCNRIISCIILTNFFTISVSSFLCGGQGKERGKGDGIEREGEGGRGREGDTERVSAPLSRRRLLLLLLR